jgi:hypothetical protein
METKIVWQLSRETSEKIVTFEEELGIFMVKNEDRREFYDVIGNQCRNFEMTVHPKYTTFVVKGGMEVEDGRVKNICLGVVRF